MQPVNDTNHTQCKPQARLGLSVSTASSASASHSCFLCCFPFLDFFFRCCCCCCCCMLMADVDVVAGKFCGNKLKHRSNFSHAFVVFVWLAAKMRPYRSSLWFIYNILCVRVCVCVVIVTAKNQLCNPSSRVPSSLANLPLYI